MMDEVAESSNQSDAETEGIPISSESDLETGKKTRRTVGFFAPIEEDNKIRESQPVIEGDVEDVRIKKRLGIAKEIFKTECSYVNHLKVVIEEYMIPLQTDENLKSLISQAEFKMLFSNIEVIFKFHSEFLVHLSEIMKDWKPNESKLSPWFLSIADYLKVYTPYVNNYHDAHFCLKGKVNDSKEIATFFYQKKMSIENHLELDDLLIMPVQRIPRYAMLLSDLVKNTSKTHPDYDELCKAKDKITEVAEFVNEQKRKVENIAKMKEIIESISGLETKHKLLSPTRLFVKEGDVMEVADEGEKSKCYLLLFNDILMWTHRKKKVNNFQRMHYLSEMEIFPGNYEGLMAVTLVMGDEKCVILAETEEITGDWFEDLLQCKADLLQRENFLKVDKRKTFLHQELKQVVGKKKAKQVNLDDIKTSFVALAKKVQKTKEEEVLQDPQKSRGDSNVEDKSKAHFLEEKRLALLNKTNEIFSKYRQKWREKSSVDVEGSEILQISAPVHQSQPQGVSYAKPAELLQRARSVTEGIAQKTARPIIQSNKSMSNIPTISPPVKKDNNGTLKREPIVKNDIPPVKRDGLPLKRDVPPVKNEFVMQRRDTLPSKMDTPPSPRTMMANLSRSEANLLTPGKQALSPVLPLKSKLTISSPLPETQQESKVNVPTKPPKPPITAFNSSQTSADSNQKLLPPMKPPKPQSSETTHPPPVEQPVVVPISENVRPPRPPRQNPNHAVMPPPRQLGSPPPNNSHSPNISHHLSPVSDVTQNIPRVSSPAPNNQEKGRGPLPATPSEKSASLRGGSIPVQPARPARQLPNAKAINNPALVPEEKATERRTLPETPYTRTRSNSNV